MSKHIHKSQLLEYSWGFRSRRVCVRMANTILSSEHSLTYPMEDRNGVLTISWSLFHFFCSHNFQENTGIKIEYEFHSTEHEENVIFHC